MTRDMSASPFRSLPATALVVDPDGSDLVVVTSALTSAGFTVTGTSDFRNASALLVEATPDLLVTEIRLGAYNGLQLAYRAKSMRPPVTIVLTSTYQDTVLQRDMQRMGATFVLKPVSAQDFVAAVYRTALRQPSSEGTFEPIQPPFERRQSDRRQSPADAFLEGERRRTERRRQRVLLASRLPKT